MTISKSKYSREEKQECLLNHFAEYKDKKKEAYQYYKDAKAYVDSLDPKSLDLRTYNNIMNELSLHMYKFDKQVKKDSKMDCCQRLENSRRDKTRRVREKISDLVNSKKAIFLTLTFTDDVLNNTTPETRRRYVSRYLKEQCDVYVANIDFGDSSQYVDRYGNIQTATHREHYHCVCPNYVSLTAWSYGIAFAERLRTNGNSEERVSKYITKLTNHAIKKSTTCNLRLIYSRNTI